MCIRDRYDVVIKRILNRFPKQKDIIESKAQYLREKGAAGVFIGRLLDVYKRQGNKFEYTFWQKYDENNTVIRLVTSWATDEKMVDEFLKII